MINSTVILRQLSKHSFAIYVTFNTKGNIGFNSKTYVARRPGGHHGARTESGLLT